MPKKKDGSSPQPTRRTVHSVAVALDIPLSEALKAAGYAGNDLEPEEMELMRQLGFILKEIPPAKRKEVFDLLKQDAAKYRSLLLVA